MRKYMNKCSKHLFSEISFGDRVRFWKYFLIVSKIYVHFTRACDLSGRSELTQKLKYTCEHIRFGKTHSNEHLKLRNVKIITIFYYMYKLLLSYHIIFSKWRLNFAIHKQTWRFKSHTCSKSGRVPTYREYQSAISPGYERVLPT
jgi:hypothetical protein